MQSQTLILSSPFRLDVRNEQLWRDNDLATVRPKPFAILAYWATHPGRLVAAAELRKAVWPQTYVGEGLLRGYIREVRIVLGEDPEQPRFIETIPRLGYRFLPPLTTLPVRSSRLSVVEVIALDYLLHCFGVIRHREEKIATRNSSKWNLERRCGRAASPGSQGSNRATPALAVYFERGRNYARAIPDPSR